MALNPLVAAHYEDPQAALIPIGAGNMAGTENLSMQDAKALFDTAGQSTREQHVQGRVLTAQDKQNPPPLPTPAPDRPSMLQRAYTVVPMWGAQGAWDGRRTEVVNGVSQPQGVSKPGVVIRGNTYRLPPQPWDSKVYWGQRGMPGGSA